MYLSELLGERLGELASERLEVFEHRMLEELRKLTPTSFYDPLVYAVRGGKRIRPLILLFASEILGPPPLDPYPAAIAVELLHCESLIHDDIIDKETSRRGLEPFYLKFGPVLSMLSADFVLGLSLNFLSRYKRSLLMRAIANELSRSVMEMCEGELLENELLNGGKAGWRYYLKVVRLKTAPLFRASAKLGGLIATKGRRSEVVKALTKYGLLVGIAYQLRDDVLDAEKGEDLALRLSSLDNVERIQRLSRSLVEKAKMELRRFSSSPAREVLERIAEIMVEREI